METRILVAYASKSGTAAEVAQAVGRALPGKSVAVDVRPAQEVSSLDGYQAVVIGSGVRLGRWLPQAVEFVRKHEAQLRQVSTALFTVHMLWIDDSETSRRNRQAYSAPVREIITPKTEAFFAGRIEMARLSFMERVMTKAVRAPEADSRDRDAIRAWAEGLLSALGSTHELAPQTELGRMS